MTIFVPELIRRKRDGERLRDEEIRALVAGFTAGELPEYQMSALLMAIVFRGLDDDELDSWTDAMLRSGVALGHADVAAPKVDKHSTGGVGDKISICLAPLVAGCGVPVPMISGRGLGHTGGTLDKLESIPGMRTDLSADEMERLLAEQGLFFGAQTDQLAPADRALYALRDVTGTVESIPLIASSIMSKKLAEGIDGLVLDVKVGAGAFMPDLERARTLARTLIRIGRGAGRKVRALLTEMDAPIGAAVGNALETAEAIAVLAGGGPPDTVELTVELGAEMLVLGGASGDLDDGRRRLRRAIDDGSGLERLARIVAAQGGDPAAISDPGRLPEAAHLETVLAGRDGWIVGISPRAVARSANSVGAGRAKLSDRIEPAAGVTLLVRRGEAVEAGQPLAVLHHDRPDAAEALAALRDAFEIGDEPVRAASRIIERVGDDGAA